jgi:glycosyltransferase involved in cell wall biosynthesis
MIVQAFNQMPDRKLVVIGEGPDFAKVKAIAGDNITLLGFQSSEVLVDHMQRAKAFVFAAEEDFGIVPVEALSCGTPVIAFNKGGVTETVLDGKHGLLFDEQSKDCLIEAITRFEAQNDFGQFDPATLHARSLEFSTEQFKKQITAFVTELTNDQSASKLKQNHEEEAHLDPVPTRPHQHHDEQLATSN